MYLAAVVFLLLSSAIAVFNWACVIASYRLRHAGIRRHVSCVPVVGVIFVFLAAMLSLRATAPPISGWLLVAAALADPATLSILYLPVFLLGKKFPRA